MYYASAGDRGTQRGAVLCLTSIVGAWGVSVPGFETYLYERIVPVAFEAPATAGFDLADAQAQQVLTDLAALVRKAHGARGDELTAFLGTQYLPSIQCPDALAATVVASLASPDPKAFRRALLAFAQASQGGGGGAA